MEKLSSFFKSLNPDAIYPEIVSRLPDIAVSHIGTAVLGLTAILGLLAVLMPIIMSSKKIGGVLGIILCLATAGMYLSKPHFELAAEQHMTATQAHSSAMRIPEKTTTPVAPVTKKARKTTSASTSTVAPEGLKVSRFGKGYAIIVVAGQEQMMRPGDDWMGYSMVSATPTVVVIKDGRTVYRIVNSGRQ
ncbi:MAG: hypothetical protein ACE5F3_03665 [Mariprofundaceae bacterium]